MNKKRIAVLGAGISGMAAAALLAKEGYEVKVFEKNDRIGGRARVEREKGFTFDMGPTWYLMPEIFDQFFQQFGKSTEDYYDLIRLDPDFRIFYSSGEFMDIGSGAEKTGEVFEKLEPGGKEKLRKYLELAEYKYDIALKEFLYKDYGNLFDFINRRMATEGLKMNVFQKLDRYAKKFFKSARARQILEYNIVFLGGAPKKSPALYSIMSHVDLNLGVWYPMGGIWKLPDALYELAKEMGVEFSLNDEVKSIVAEQKRAKKIISERGETEVDAVVASAEYPHVEMELLDSNHRTYPEKYWEKKTMAPSMYLVYLGLDKKIKPLAHHNFYFPEDWDPHFKSLFDKKAWPENPAYYVGCPSKTDPSVAPEGGELVFLLVPVAPGLEDSDEVRESYEQKILDHLEKTLGENIRDHIVIKKVFSHRDFEKTYHAYKGTALGLAHTLFQTAIFRPSNRSRKVKNLYFTGQYTNPGIGVPMALISSEIVSNKIKKEIS